VKGRGATSEKRRGGATMTTLREFKVKYLTKLLNLKKQLVEKYHDKADRIDYIVDLLASKLENLRTFTLTDYIFTLYQASKEFKELEELIPSVKEINELLRGDTKELLEKDE
jgi:hypothetical protein